MLLDGRQQQGLQLQHLRDLPPCEHPAHQHQYGKGISLERFGRTFVQRLKYILRLQRCQQDARIAADDPQQRSVVFAPPVGGDGVQILFVLLIPAAEALPIQPLRFRLHRQKAPLGARFHHMVEAIGRSIRQARDEGVLLCEPGEDLPRVRIARDILRHLHGKLIGKPHNRQKLPLLFRQRIDHGSGKGGINVGMAAGQHTALGERAQIQIHGGKPALAGIEKAFDLRIGKLRAAAVRINGKLRMVEAQLLRADLIHPRPQPHHLRSRQKAIPAGDDQMHIRRQPVCQHTEKQRGALVGQQVKIVDEQIAGRFPRQLMAEIVRQQASAGGVRGTGILPQQVDARAGKGVLRAPPEDRKIVGIHADADDAQRPGLCALLQIPVHRGGLSVAHRGDHGGQRAAGDRPQALLQPLGYVDGVQLPLWLRHGASSVRRCALTIFYTKTGPLASGKRKEECAASLFSSLLFYALMASS